MSVCPHCAQEVAQEAHFCTNCGSRLAPGVNSSPVESPSFAAAAPAPARQRARDVTTGLPENVAGALAYFFLPAILFLFVSPYKKNRSVRFHSFQCLLTVGAFMVMHLALAFLGKALPLLVLPLFGLLFLAEITLWLLLMLKAYRHEMLRLPLVGELADELACRN